MVGHVRLHDFCWVLAFEDEALTESSIETEMGFMGKPNEVRNSIVGDVAIQMMTLMVAATGTDPSFGDENVAVRSSDEVAHPRVVGMDVGFGMEVLGLVVMNFVESSG